jgi:CBS domain containing-hemolysin-like protein
VKLAIENPDRVIAATQLGITIASLGLGWLGEPALSHLLFPIVSLFPGEIQSEVSHSISAGIAFALITFMHVVVGELMPKSIALQNPEKTSIFVARPTVLTERIFKPVIWLLNGSGAILLKLIGVKPASGHEMVHSVEEMKMIVTARAQEGVVETAESDMLHAVFDFGELLVRQVMIPRTEITGVEADASLEEIIQLVDQTTYSKLPVYEDDLDLILGIIHQDLLHVLSHAMVNLNVSAPCCERYVRNAAGE